MPDPVVAAPAAPAAAPANPPAPVTPPATPAPPETGAQDPLLKSLFDDLGAVLETPAAPPSTAAPAPAVAPTTPGTGAPAAQLPGTAPGGVTVTPPGIPGAPAGAPGAPAAPGTPAAPQTPAPGVTVRREKPIAEVVEGVLRKVMADTTPAAPAPAVPPITPPEPEDPFIANMVPEEKEQYELAKWADENVPEFKGQAVAGKFLNFYKAVDQYITTERAKDPNRKFDETDEAFQAFVESSRPDIEPARWDKLKTDRLIAQVEERTTRTVSEKFSKENEDLKRRQTLLEKRPIIESRLGQFRDNIGRLMTEDTTSPLPAIAAKIGAEGVEKAIEADPLFTPIVVTAYGHGERAAAEFLAMAEGVKDFDPKDQVQDWVVRFIRRAGETFAAKGGDKLLRQTEDGSTQTFLPRGKYNQLKQTNPAELGRHWTFSNEDILLMIERNTKDHISALVRQETERLAKAGYVRPAPAATPGAPSDSRTANPPATNGTTATPPEPVGSPRAGVSAAPGQGGGSVAVQTAMSDAELAILGFPRKAA